MTFNRIRAGIVAPGLWSGGAEHWMISMADYCDRRAIEWIGAAVRYPDSAHGATRAPLSARMPVGVGTEALDALYAAADAVLVWGVCSADQRLPARPRTCKVALVSHGVGHWSARIFERPEDADSLVGVSPSSLSPMPPAVRHRARVILNCHVPERIVPTGPDAACRLRDAWGVRPGERVVGYLGRLAPEKNPEGLLELALARPDVRGVYVGEGGAREGLRSRAAEAGVADRVVFHGLVDHPGDVLGAFDWLLLPSHEEACAITLLEAWAAGVPAIATPVGVVTEHPDLVRMVPIAPTGPALASAFERDLADPEGVAARVERARCIAETVYAPARFGREWTDFLCDLAGPRPERPALGDVFAAPPNRRVHALAVANACKHRSRRNWHAICNAHRRGVEGHWVVTADDCAGCMRRGGHL